MLTDQEKKQLFQLIECGEPIPTIYRPKPFNPYEAELFGTPVEYKVINQSPTAPFQKIRSFNSDKPFIDDWSNMLIFGDNLFALESIYEDQRGENKLQTKNRIKLIYTDTPFTTKKGFMTDSVI